MKTVNQNKNNKPWLWKPGQSGNLKGRPKGKTLKEWAREKLMSMDETQKTEFIKMLPEEIIWKMAEGNPAQEVMGKGGKDLIPIQPSKSIKQLAKALLDEQRKIHPTTDNSSN